MSLSPQRSLPTGGLDQLARKREMAPLSPRRGSARNLFLDLPIAGRLTLGFVVAALVAALAAGAVGIQRAQSLSRQTDFYHNLLQFNTSLTTGRGFLELMNSKLHQTLDDANAPNPSRETLATDANSLKNLAYLYTQTLSKYTQNDLLDQHADQQALLDEAGESGLVSQQRTLANSALRTWQFYQAAQQQILDSLASGDLQNAQLMLQQQGEPTNADALSALHSLIQLNDRLASAVDNATNVEIHNQLLTTLLATLCAFLAIALVGWFISETLVRRLRYLHRVTRAVEEGRINERVQVIGRDEIADVSIAVNAMVDTIVGLLEETRQQRDALAGAAEHLFSDMRIVNAGDLHVSATVSNDPIGMLANAFNFTVGRFRRFVLRTSTTIEQLDVISRQGLERSNAFISLVRAQLRDVPPPHPHATPATLFGKKPQSGQLAHPISNPLRADPYRPGFATESAHDASAPSQSAQDGPLYAAREDLNKRLNSTREIVEAASLSLGRLSELIAARPGLYAGTAPGASSQAQFQELAALEKLLNNLAWGIRQTQFNAANNFARIDAAFVHLGHTTTPRPDAVEVSETLAHVSDAQFQEFARQAGSFALEVNALAKRLAAMLQEMRSSTTPFRLEGGVAGMSDPHGVPTGLAFPEQPFPSATSGKLLSSW